MAAGVFPVAGTRRPAAAAARLPRPADRHVSPLSIASAFRRSENRDKLRRRNTAAILRRRISLAGARRRSGARLSLTPARRATAHGDLRHQLRPGGGGRLLWTTVRLAKSHQWTSKLFSLGTASLHRRDHDPDGRERGRSAQTLRIRNSR